MKTIKSIIHAGSHLWNEHFWLITPTLILSWHDEYTVITKQVQLGILIQMIIQFLAAFFSFFISLKFIVFKFKAQLTHRVLL